MNTLASINELARAIRNMIRTGVIVETDLNAGRCRVQTGGNVTDWLLWLTQRAGHSRTWWAPSIGEQVLILAVGGELDTAFVLPGIFSDNHPAPSASADALHITFPDGAVDPTPTARALRAFFVPLTRRTRARYERVTPRTAAQHPINTITPVTSRWRSHASTK